MKKALEIILVLVMTLVLAACSSSGNNTSPDTSGKAKTYKVGVAIYQFDDNFMTLYRNELQSYFKSLETDTVKYDITVVDGKNDMAEQNNQIDNFITQGMDAIILNLVQTSSADAAINKIVDAGIPLILITASRLVTTVTSPTRESSTMLRFAMSALMHVSPAHIRARSYVTCPIMAM